MRQVKILKKEGDVLQLLAFPSDMEMRKGDYLVAEDDNGRKALLQVIDVGYANTPGILEDLLRTMSTEKVEVETRADTLNICSFTLLIKDARMISAKIRGIVEYGEISHGSSWLPSRFSARTSKAGVGLLKEVGRLTSNHPVTLGKVAGETFSFDADCLDGRLTIVTGKKETGKSHAAKVICKSLVEHGATVVVFDVNGEYINLGRSRGGAPNNIYGRTKVLEPGTSFKITVKEAGLGVMLNILAHIYDTPATSCREFARIWRHLRHSRINVTFESIRSALENTGMHDSVREALSSRISALESTGFFTRRATEATHLDRVINRSRGGLLLVLNMRNLLASTRRMVVECVLSQLGGYLARSLIPPLFLVAEEAHLYLNNTYWDDLVTRMRHLGLFPLFVTNQPDTIPHTVYRQADNILLFNFTNELDLEAISRASRADSQSVKMIATALPPRHCLTLGHLVGDLPLVVKVRGLDAKTMGETRLFFGGERQPPGNLREIVATAS